MYGFGLFSSVFEQEKFDYLYIGKRKTNYFNNLNLVA